MSEVVRGKRLARAILWIALAVVVTLLVAHMTFDVLMLSLYAIGILASGIFCLTWFPLALRALRHHRKDVSLVRIIDYAGVQVAIFLAFVLILRSALVYGLPPVHDAWQAAGRLLLPITIDFVLLLRLGKWGARLAENYRCPPDPLEHVHREAKDPVTGV